MTIYEKALVEAAHLKKRENSRWEFSQLRRHVFLEEKERLENQVESVLDSFKGKHGITRVGANLYKSSMSIAHMAVKWNEIESEDPLEVEIWLGKYGTNLRIYWEVQYARQRNNEAGTDLDLFADKIAIHLL